MNDYTVDTITRDDRPGWRARIEYDTTGQEPYGDALAPVLIVPYRGQPYFGREVYVPTDADALISVLRWYIARHGVHNGAELFSRYLRIVDGTSTVETFGTRDGLVLIFDTADWRSHVGVIQLPVDLSGEAAEWRAYFDGEVYGVIVEQLRTGRTIWDDGSSPDRVEEWTVEESCWGFFGTEYASTEARRMLDDASV